MDFLVAPTRVVTARTAGSTGLECQRMELGEPDASGRRSPKPVRGSEFVIDVRLRHRRHRPEHHGQRAGRRARCRTSCRSARRLNLTRWQTVQVERGDLRDHRGRRVLGRRRRHRRGHRDRGHRRRAQGGPRHRHLHPTGKARAARAGGVRQPQGHLRKVTVEDLRSQEPKPTRARCRSSPSRSASRGFAEVELGYAPEDVTAETTRCLECGCVALFDCDLRRYATEYGVEIKQFLGEARQYKVDRTPPADRAGPQQVHPLRALRAHLQRGRRRVGATASSTAASAPWSSRRWAARCSTPSACAAGCASAPAPPAPSRSSCRSPSPGRGRPSPRRAVCHYCGVGCRLDYDVYGNTLVKVSRNEENAVTLGNHCKKGRFGYNYVQAHDRLLRGARPRRARAAGDAPSTRRSAYTAMRLKELSRRYRRPTRWRCSSRPA